MAEKKFSSKKEVLEYLGKSPKDTRLVDRMISRNEIRRVDGCYELVQGTVDDESEQLRKRVADLELELEMCRAEKDAAQK